MLGSIGLDRTGVLITNIIPWRPPGNRSPSDVEVATCLPFVMRHIALVAPRHVLLLGATSARALTGNSQGIRRIRGNWYDLEVPGMVERVPALATYHPAYLMRTPSAKREAWNDLISLQERVQDY
jgi:uracil-DNA glycosylase